MYSLSMGSNIEESPETIPPSSLAPGTRDIMSGTQGPVLQDLTSFPAPGHLRSPEVTQLSLEASHTLLRQI